MNEQQLGTARLPRVIVAGGGTGGHLFPGLAVVSEIRTRMGGADCLFVGTERGIEARVIPARGEQLALLNVTPLKGRSPAELMRSLGRLPGALGEARKVVADFAPDLVLGVGGYAAGPALMAARTLGIPTALLEQNAHVGLTNRILSKVVGRAYLSFASTAPRFGRRGRVVGNPVRAEIVAQAARAAMDPEGFEARARTVLVLGGSQGAKALNDTVPEVLAAAGAAQNGLRVIHQTGKDAQPRVAEHYARLGVDAEVVPFIDDMATAYSEAALVIARAGATTLAELAALGRPSLLVPYPFAADDHQTKNARAFEAAGAAWCVPQDEMDVEAMAHWTRELWGDAARRRLMAEAARGLGRPDAAAAIVDDLCEWLGWLPDGGRKVSAHADSSAGESTTAVDDVGIEGDESGETLPGLGPSDVQVPSNEEVSSDKEAQLPAIACDSRVDLNDDSDRVSDSHLDADSALPLDRAVESALVWNRNEAEGAVHGEALRIASDWASRWGMSDSFVTDSFDEDASGSEQLRGEGAYVPRFRARPLVERRPLVFAERLAWD